MTIDSELRPSLEDLIVSNSDVLGGQPVFRRTRVPVEVLFENLADGLSLEQILDEYRTLDRGDLVRVLKLTTAKLAASKAE